MFHDVWAFSSICSAARQFGNLTTALMWYVGGSRGLLMLLRYCIGRYGLFRWFLVSFGNDL